MRRRLIVFALTALAAGAQVPQFESWTDTTFTAWRNQRTEVNVNAQLRAYPTRFDAYRTRTGPIIEHRLRDGLSFWGGAYFQHLQSGVGEKQTFDNFARFFGGLTYRLYRNRLIQLDGRTVAERFWGIKSGDYSRFRHRFLLTTNKTIGPYVSNELFATRTGLLSDRVAAGLRTRITPEWSMLTGYLYENRSFANQPNRHVLVISVTYRKAIIAR
ncbi:MAG: DUF2490 domain-containing protein [Bryobacteraceae bacterium]|nr:DUF2490 domain-containing protein [Bryobacteraceae bacterium]